MAAALGDLAVTLQGQPDIQSTLKVVIEAIVDLIPEASWAGISVVERGSISPVMPADAVAEELDRLQNDLGEGPLFDALEELPTLHLPDFRTETRWPAFIETATRRGVHCMLSFRLFVNSGSLGVLNIYGPRPGVFSADSLTTGEILAQHVAVALAGAEAEEQFQQAIASRDIIGQAKGILMHRDKLTALQAFATLTKASQETNMKLVDVARWFVGEHEGSLEQPVEADR